VFVLRSVRIAARILALGSLGFAVGCFRGGEREKEAPAGYLGGKCQAPAVMGGPPVCQEGMCNENRNYCYDPVDPCEGFFCGGSERGFCQPDASNLPSCVCEVGYTTDRYYLYCCPEASLGIVDPRCNVPGGDDPRATDDGTDESTGGLDSDGSTGA
jgi:hypothetical protein